MPSVVPNQDCACSTATPADFKFLYDAKAQTIKSKIEAIVRGAYGGSGATYSEAAEALHARPAQMVVSTRRLSRALPGPRRS